MTDTETFKGYTPEEMELPADLVGRIRLVCRLLGLPVAERSSGHGVVLGREDPWRPGEKANHVTVAWNVSDELMDVEELGAPGSPSDRLYGASDALEAAVVEALRRGGLVVEQDPETLEWKVWRIAGPSPLD
ncbi:hypothetical protein [Kitasatospora cineracea]|uniref:Uncharacterized protein n=1 Tax=Kitasatospora cineracea TaxID=88074 RepID=A0A3N4R6I6_9ACTN|nr:hypothetical protein [Kitasatospora cineracea]RPE26585.1 hypothetical protein EDD38_7646 [Kitasatospora cineracea]